MAVRPFYDFLVEEGLRESNPVSRGRYTPGRRGSGRQRGLAPRFSYDAALRREELCSLRTDDLDPAHRTVRARAETTKNRLERVVPYSAATGVLLTEYLVHRATISRARP